MVGAKPNFTKKDILLTFLNLKHPCSRSFLVHSVGIGEGSMRTILDILKNQDYIESSTKGHSLTAKGKDHFNSLLDLIEPPKNIHSEIYKDLSGSAIVIKTNVPQSISIDARDEAIRNGAKAALILTYNEKLQAPQLDKDFSDIENQLALNQHNVVIITFADDQFVAQKAALAVALDFSKELNDSATVLSE